jgi:hypothetical protein
VLIRDQWGTAARRIWCTKKAQRSCWREAGGTLATAIAVTRSVRSCLAQQVGVQFAITPSRFLMLISFVRSFLAWWLSSPTQNHAPRLDTSELNREALTLPKCLLIRPPNGWRSGILVSQLSLLDASLLFPVPIDELGDGSLPSAICLLLFDAVLTLMLFCLQFRLLRVVGYIA